LVKKVDIHGTCSARHDRRSVKVGDPDVGVAYVGEPGLSITVNTPSDDPRW
jgi:hypothetical protein